MKRLAVEPKEKKPVVTSHYQSEGFEPLLDSTQAAKLLNIHPKTLKRMARKGEVPAIQIGKLWRFRTSSLDMWTRSRLTSVQPLVPV